MPASASEGQGRKALGAAALLGIAALFALTAGACAQGEQAAVELRIKVAAATPRSITLVWETQTAEAGAVWFGAYETDGMLPPPLLAELRDQARQNRIAEKQPARYHRVTVSGLSPSTRYVFFVEMPSGAWGIATAATTPGPGRTQFLRLPVLVVIYTPITYRDSQRPLASLPRNLSASDIAQIRANIAEVRDFFWRNSRGCLDLVFDYAFLNRTFSAKDEEVEAVFEKDFEEAVKLLGRKVEDYTGVIFLYGWDEYADPAKRRTLYRGQAFGGLTYGTDAPWKFKNTPHSWIHYHHNAHITWVVLHEYHHQLDSLFHSSGYPEYPFNHPTPKEPVGVFGEHFDVNAFILRTWPRWKWGGLRWGKLVVARDTDSDGLPDRADVALDEERFGSDPASKDTDGDGLSDLDEMAATSGIWNGLDEQMLGPIFKPNPRSPDSDRDGIPDGRDPYPLYRVSNLLKKASPVIDGVLSQGEWPAFAEGSGHGLVVRTFAAWDEEYLYFAAQTNRPVELRLDIDAANNGWFAGSDNYRISVAPPKNGETFPKVDVAVFDWEKFYSEPQGDVYWNREKVKPSDLKVAVGSLGAHSAPAGKSGGYVFELAVPRNEKTGLLLKAGAVINIKPSFVLPNDPRNALTLFEPHQLINCRLTASK